MAYDYDDNIFLRLGDGGWVGEEMCACGICNKVFPRRVRVDTQSGVPSTRMNYHFNVIKKDQTRQLVILCKECYEKGVGNVRFENDATD